jgi:hypothetical protein
LKRAVSLISGVVLKHLSERRAHLDLLMHLEASSEDWFRIELLVALSSVPGLVVTGTNRRHEVIGRDRPDFEIQLRGRKVLFELKALPTGRNYRGAWQRFQAGPNNAKDFENLANGRRDGIIYLYWPNEALWRKCSRHLCSKYGVQCVREDRIACKGGSVIVSYWAATD